MQKILSISLGSTKSKAIFFAIGLAICLVLPAFFHNQWITGPIINATLLLATVLVGPTEAVLLGLMPSTMAFLGGLLPLPLAPMLPFIMIGNAIMVMTFHTVRPKNFWGAVGLAALLKFAFMHGSVVFLLSRMMDSGLTAKLAVMMSWPQFFTAIIGGAIIYPIVKSIQNK
jgi:hypothetical protein